MAWRLDCSLYKQFTLIPFLVFRFILIYLSFFTEFYFLFTIQSLFFFLDTEFVLFLICSDLIENLYVEHATFTPLIIGTNGGMGDECEKFLKNLAELLAKEDGEDYSDVMMSLRTMLSFQVLRAAVLCVTSGGQGDHGHRTLPSYPQTLA